MFDWYSWLQGQGSANLDLIVIEQRQLQIKTFSTFVKKQKRQKAEVNFYVKQVLNIDLAAAKASGSILHNHQFITASWKEKAFSSKQRFSPELAGTTSGIIVWHLWNGWEKAKSISLRRPRIVIRIGLPVAGGQQWFMEQTLTQGNREERIQGRQREQAWLIRFAQESDYTFPFPTTLPPSLHVSC